MDFFDDKTILVTGGTGSIGKEIVKQLLKRNVKKVVVFSRDEIKHYVMKNEIGDQRLEFIMGDTRDYNSLEFAFEKNTYDIVFHAAAMKHLVVCEEEPIECSKTNIIGAHNLVRLCNLHKVRKLITVSTDKAASPTSVMGASKFIAERITLNGNINSSHGVFSCVRLGNVANSRGSVIPIMVSNLLESREVWISNPDVTRFIMRIDDAVDLILRAAEISKGGEILVLKMRSFILGDLAEVFEKKIGPKVNKRIKVARRDLVLGEKMHEDLLNKDEVNHLFENDLFYLIINNKNSGSEYKGFKKAQIERYDSDSVDKLDQDELEEIILEYMKGIRQGNIG